MNLKEEIKFTNNFADSQIKSVKQVAEEAIKDIEHLRDERVKFLQSECVRVHGAHIDDGGFLFATCKNCGYINEAPTDLL